MAAEGVDYSTSRPRPWVLRQAGKTFAMRYIGPGSTGKHLTNAEAKTLVDAGLSIVAVAEGFAQDALHGRSMGITHGRAAVAAAHALSMPAGRPIYFAVDFDATASQLPTVAQYLAGVDSVSDIYQVGVYGGVRTINYCHDHSPATWYFQTYAWSAGQVSRWTHVRQYLNGQTIDGGRLDLDHAYTADFGQWTPSGGIFGSAPPPPPPGTVATPWDWTPVVDLSSSEFTRSAAALAGAANAIEKGF